MVAMLVTKYLVKVFPIIDKSIFFIFCEPLISNSFALFTPIHFHQFRCYYKYVRIYFVFVCQVFTALIRVVAGISSLPPSLQLKLTSLNLR